MIEKSMLKLTKSALFLSFLIAAVWALVRPGYDSIAAAVGAFAAFLSSSFMGKKKDSGQQVQKVSGGSFGIQSAGDVKIVKINRK